MTQTDPIDNRAWPFNITQLAAVRSVNMAAGEEAAPHLEDNIVEDALVPGRLLPAGGGHQGQEGRGGEGGELLLVLLQLVLLLPLGVLQ